MAVRLRARQRMRNARKDEPDDLYVIRMIINLSRFRSFRNSKQLAAAIEDALPDLGEEQKTRCLKLIAEGMSRE